MHIPNELLATILHLALDDPSTILHLALINKFWHHYVVNLIHTTLHLSTHPRHLIRIEKLLHHLSHPSSPSLSLPYNARRIKGIHLTFAHESGTEAYLFLDQQLPLLSQLFNHLRHVTTLTISLETDECKHRSIYRHFFSQVSCKLSHVQHFNLYDGCDIAAVFGYALKQRLQEWKLRSFRMNACPKTDWFPLQTLLGHDLEQLELTSLVYGRVYTVEALYKANLEKLKRLELGVDRTFPFDALLELTRMSPLVRHVHVYGSEGSVSMQRLLQVVSEFKHLEYLKCHGKVFLADSATLLGAVRFGRLRTFVLQMEGLECMAKVASVIQAEWPVLVWWDVPLLKWEPQHVSDLLFNAPNIRHLQMMVDDAVGVLWMLARRERPQLFSVKLSTSAETSKLQEVMEAVTSACMNAVIRVDTHDFYGKRART